MFVARLWQLLFAAWVVFASPSTTIVTRDDSNFVSIQNGKFIVNGKPFRFVGTNLYSLATLNTDDDIDSTLGSMASAGIKVARVWAFNDVQTIPKEGTWFQLIAADGSTQLNTGPNGLQKLDTIFRLAKKHNIYILLTLTNNWNPQSKDASSVRNTLSNDYGGMDAYVRRFGTDFHDEFYTDSNILSVFSEYVRQVVKRYADTPQLFAWELANDPRCYSSLPSSSTCTTQTITKWHSQIAQVVKSVDPNHLVASGGEGFLCVGCSKLFTPSPSTPPPQPSAASRRRSNRLSVRAILDTRKAFQERTSKGNQARAVKIRGRWISPESRQNDDGSRTSYDGFHGVDSEDILSIPEIGFSTFQLFPDQNIYATTDPNLPSFNRTVQAGVEWIKRQAAIGASAGKPVMLNAFGLLTQDNLPFFVPFNRSTVSSSSSGHSRRQASSSGVTDDQRDDAYGQWFQAGLLSGVQGMLQYQWSQSGLTGVQGTDVGLPVGGTPTGTVVTGTATTPNDGYSINGVGQTNAINTIQAAAAQFASD